MINRKSRGLPLLINTRAQESHLMQTESYIHIGFLEKTWPNSSRLSRSCPGKCEEGESSSQRGKHEQWHKNRMGRMGNDHHLALLEAKVIRVSKRRLGQEKSYWTSNCPLDLVVPHSTGSPFSLKKTTDRTSNVDLANRGDYSRPSLLLF